jgi:hypothetical protein
MDSLDFYLKNLSLAGERADLYRRELQKAAELIEWKKKWHPRGDKRPDTSKRVSAWVSIPGADAATSARHG